MVQAYPQPLGYMLGAIGRAPTEGRALRTDDTVAVEETGTRASAAGYGVDRSIR